VTNYLWRCTLTKNQFTAKPVQFVFERCEAVVEPPLCCTAKGANAGGDFIQDEHHNNRLTTINCCNKSRIICNAKVIAQPYK
jgi:hypothetical protein